MVDSQTLKQRGTTLGNALSGELGIHSSQFGGGASTPIIRGQERKRAKILQNNGETFDMSELSPDHAVTVDALLAKRIEILRGPTTLLYSAGNNAGLINVVDEKIPSVLPEKGYEGQAGVRFSSANKERLTYVGSTFALGNNLPYVYKDYITKPLNIMHRNLPLRVNLIIGCRTVIFNLNQARPDFLGLERKGI
ncbi:TonB-dependent receptor [Actinobacillus equuli]|nr:TonB-dependent receptor [Actinobacillus equuli]